jgi:hypothetical protein
MFMLMRAEVEMKIKDWPNALKTLEAAYDLPGVKDPSVVESKPSKKKYSMPFGLEERARIFLNLV